MAEPSQQDSVRPAPQWHPATRLLFRFAFAYFLLCNLPFPLTWLFYIPHADVVLTPLLKPYWAFWRAAVPWVGKHLFAVNPAVRINGSGDSTWGYVQVFCWLTLALAATVAWTLLDRRRQSYVRLHEWLRVYVRFALAAAMVTYGAIKVIKSQFPDPALDRLLQPLGDASPMGLLWTFMGASQSYNVFSGAGEMLGGLRLTLRRTTLLGALVSIAVLGNIVMLNFSYDVPVKLYSAQLLVEALFLTLPDLRRLGDMFLLNRRVAPAADRPLFRRAGLHRGALALRTGLVVLFVVFSLADAYDSGRDAKQPQLYGIWNVDELTADGRVLPPSVADASRWRRMIFDFPGMMSIQTMDDSRHRYNLVLDPVQHTLALTSRDDPQWKSALSYRQPDPRSLTVAGKFGDRQIQARLHWVKAPKFLLTSRGFHWINEYPFNR